MSKPITCTWYMGIDPGANGGIVAANDSRPRIVKWQGLTSRADLARFLSSFVSFVQRDSCASVRAVVELNSSSPQMGVVSAFTFGRNCERPSAMLSALGIPYEEVRPQVWQRFLHIPPRKKATKGKAGETNTQWKDRLRSKAQQMFPSMDLWDRTKTIQRAVCDAVLIAEYCRRIHLGQ